MSLSRKYRPQQFADITGQSSVKETLRREVETGKIGHAYLLFGPRGVGKTTTARIFAKALNCLNPEKGEPCNVCDRCKDANEGRAIDLIEMDAASHTGVDNIREGIVDHVRFAPSHAKYKVYILDEAHMLSTPAWNAMLKTLEEPPAHGIFILATTEFHKVPATIVSRCQRFEFTRVERGDVEDRIREIATREKATLEDDVIKRISKHSDGSVRDAETILGQLLALGTDQITQDVAGLLLPLSRLPLAAKFLSVASTRLLRNMMDTVATIDEQGVQIIPFFHDIIEAVRQLLIASDNPTYQQALKDGDEGERAIAELFNVFSPAELRDIALQCMERRRDAKQGIDPRFALELAGTAIALGILPNSPKGQREATIQPPRVEEIVIKQPPTIKEPVLHMKDEYLEDEINVPTNEEMPVQNEPILIPVEEPISEEIIPEEQKIKLSSSSSTLVFADFQRNWHAFLKRVSEEQPSLSFILKTSKPIDLKNGNAVIQVSYPFHRTKLMENVAIKQKLEDLLKEILKERIILDAVTVQKSDGADEEVGEQPARPTDTVGTLIENFGGHVVE